MINYIFYGATGRIGSLITSVLPANANFFFAKRNGNFLNSIHKKDENLWAIPNASGDFIVIDLSIDYSSVGAMQKHEEDKTNVIEMLNKTGRLKSYVGVSSGAAQFSDLLILDPFKLKYAQTKRKRKEFIRNLGIPYFYPDLFTLIGIKSFQYKNIGWVQVVNSCMMSREVSIAEPHELRSWASEDNLVSSMKNFIEYPKSNVEGGFVDGIFCLQDIVSIIEELLNKKIDVLPISLPKWLSASYVDILDEKLHSESKVFLKNLIRSMVLNNYA